MHVVTHQYDTGTVTVCARHDADSEALAGSTTYLGVHHGAHDGQCEHPDCLTETEPMCIAHAHHGAAAQHRLDEWARSPEGRRRIEAWTDD